MSKESSIKVFAENASGTRPANAIPVWIDNISAIGGGGAGDEEVNTLVHTNSATWNETANVVQSNSAQWAEGGSSDAFYIYPGKTTDKEISENSGKDLKLYNSANNTYLDYAGKTNYSTYAILNFKNITGAQGNYNTVDHLRLRVYPNATSACKIYQTTSVNLLDSNSTVNTSQTAYYDGNGNYLSQTHDELTALNQFVQSNSANWEGGSSSASDTVLYRFSQQGSYGSWNNETSYVSGVGSLYFEACAEPGQGTPNYINLIKDGIPYTQIYWSQVSSDGYYNYYSASCDGLSDGLYSIDNNGWNNYSWCYVYANDVRTNPFSQGNYTCSTDKVATFNVQGSNVSGTIDGSNQGMFTQLTSFTGTLTDFTAKGYDTYNCNISLEDPFNDGYYDISAEFDAGGSTIASSDVFPPTNNLDPYTTYYLGWNANNGGLQWFYQGGNGN